MNSEKFKALGKKQTVFKQFEVFARPDSIDSVMMVSDEVTANCPVTGQPDWYTVEIRYEPRGTCIESKTLKLYLQSFRNKGLFCEAFADKIAHDIYEAVNPLKVRVKIVQKPRGGVSIVADAQIGED